MNGGCPIKLMGVEWFRSGNLFSNFLVKGFEIYINIFWLKLFMV
jgi:hypothetical protein